MSDEACQMAQNLARNCGYACFPCRDDKSPATPHGFKDSSTDPPPTKPPVIPLPPIANRPPRGKPKPPPSDDTKAALISYLLDRLIVRLKETPAA